MKPKPRSPEETYGPALTKARRSFLESEPSAVAVKAGVDYRAGADQSGRFACTFLGTRHEISWPDGTVYRVSQGESTPADIATTLVLLHYLLTADGSAMADEWIAFRNVPGGLGYDAAFQGRANARLVRAFGSNRAAFEAAARAIGGERLTFGDAAFAFRALPRVWLAVVLYVADDEFPASARVLFDGSASRYLPTEDLAVLGGMLASRLIKAARQAGASRETRDDG
ncbi:MAG: DUF3786 domain-containing protein [Anaerolineae bacterium]|jgi:hypothetical protein